MQGLELLLFEGIIDEVHGRLKTGKEAEVFLVTHKGEVVAAKVYKDRRDRNFKNNSGYTEGRQVRNTRTQRAMNKGSRFGKAMAEDAWKQAEADALFKLHALGARVPKPVLFYGGVLLMEAVPDVSGNPALRLMDAHIPAEGARAMYEGLRVQVVKLLCADLIHGDLSPYNVLLGWDGPVIIDFPQVIKAAHNSQAEAFFTRDLENLRKFFAQMDPTLAASAGDAGEIWRAYVSRRLSPDFVPSGIPPPVQQPGRPQHQGGPRQHRGGGAQGQHGDRAQGPRGAPQGQPGDRGRGERGGPQGQAQGQRGGPDGQQSGQLGGPQGQPQGRRGGPQGQQPGQRGGDHGQQQDQRAGPQGQHQGQRGGPQGQQRDQRGGPQGQQQGQRGDSPGQQRDQRGGPQGQQQGQRGGPQGQQQGQRGGPPGQQQSDQRPGQRDGGGPRGPGPGGASGGRGPQGGRQPRGPQVEYRGGGASTAPAGPPSEGGAGFGPRAPQAPHASRHPNDSRGGGSAPQAHPPRHRR